MDPEFTVEFPSFDASRSIPEAGSPQPVLRNRYEIEAELGRGGMGVVYQVLDVDLRRRVALKVLLDAEPAPELLARFREEAQICAQLEHPAIVPLHDFGVDLRGHVFLVMKLVQGQTLSQVIAALVAGDQSTAQEFTLLKRLQLLQQIAQAMSYAHAKKVIHRDLKPDNVMLGKHGDVQIMDWGLAKVLDQVGSAADSVIRTERTEGDAAATLVGTVMGTPFYMSPEQARGQAVDRRTDIYALGAMLHELLALERPIRGESIEQVLERVEAGRIEPMPTSVPRELRAIAGKAMARDRMERYADASELAEDIQAYLEERPGIAWRESAWTRARKWARRHGTSIIAIILALLSALVASAVVLRQLHARPGELHVQVKPGDAEIWSRGKLLGRCQAGRFDRTLPPGAHRFEIRREGYAPQTLQIELQAASEATHAVTLVPRSEVLFVGTDPPGATVQVFAGKRLVRRGKSPFVETLASGTYRLRISRPTYLSQEFELTIKDGGGLVKRPLKLVRNVARLALVGSPTGARVRLIDSTGKLAATATLPLRHPLEIEPGRYTLKLEAPGHLPLSTTLALMQGQTRQLYRSLRSGLLWRVPNMGQYSVLDLLPFDADGNRKADLLVVKQRSVIALSGFSGKELWRFTPAKLRVLAAATSPQAVLVLASGSIIRLARRTGLLRSVRRVDPETRGLVLLAGSDDCLLWSRRKLLRMNWRTGEVRWQTKALPLNIHSRADSEVIVLPGAGRIIVWDEGRGNQPLRTMILELGTGAPVYSSGGSGYLGVADTDGNGRPDVALLGLRKQRNSYSSGRGKVGIEGHDQLLAVNLADGKQRWRKQKLSFDKHARQLVCRFAWSRNEVLVESRQGGVAQLRRLLAGELTEVFEREALELNYYSLLCPWPLRAPTALICQVGSSRLGAFGREGLLWSFELGAGPDRPLLMADFSGDGRTDIVVKTLRGELICIQPSGGRQAGYLVVQPKPLNGRTLFNDKLIGLRPVGDGIVLEQVEGKAGHQLIAWDLRRGRMLWSRPHDWSEQWWTTRDLDGDGLRDLALAKQSSDGAIVVTRISSRTQAAVDRQRLKAERLWVLPGQQGLVTARKGGGLAWLRDSGEKKLRWPDPPAALQRLLQTGQGNRTAVWVGDIDGDGAADLALFAQSLDGERPAVHAVCIGGQWHQRVITGGQGAGSPLIGMVRGALVMLRSNSAAHFDPRSARWSLEAGGSFSRMLRVGQQTLLIRSTYVRPGKTVGDSRLAAFRWTGQQLERVWGHDPLQLAHQPLAVDLDGDGSKDLLCVGYGGLELIAVDGKTGRILFRERLPEPVMQFPLLTDVDGDGQPDILLRTSRRWIWLDPRVGHDKRVWNYWWGPTQGGPRRLPGR